MADQDMKILVDVPKFDGHEVTIPAIKHRLDVVQHDAIKNYDRYHVIVPAEYSGDIDTATEYVAEEMYQATLGSGIPGYGMTVVIDGSASDWLSDED